MGAGPFTVVSNKLSSQLVLKKNPTYFKQDRPFLDELTFKSIGGDEAAYQALQAGQAQAYEGLSTPSLIDQMKKEPKLQVTEQLSTSPYIIQLNTTSRRSTTRRRGRRSTTPRTPRRSAPSCSTNRYPSTQGFTGPGGLFFQADCPATAPTTSSRPRRSSRSSAA